MEMIPGKLYKVLQSFESLPENYRSLPLRDCVTKTVEKGYIVMFLKKRRIGMTGEFLFLHGEIIIAAFSSDIDYSPHRFFKIV